MDKFAEYKLFVEDTARFSERRQQVTNTYITVNGAIVAFITFLIVDVRLTNWWLYAAMLPILVAGIAACYFWYRLLITYKALIGFRFEQLEALEQDDSLSDSIKMYTLEADRFYRNADPKLKIGFSRIEVRLPWLFMILYILMGVGLAVATSLVVTGIIPPPVILP